MSGGKGEASNGTPGDHFRGGLNDPPGRRKYRIDMEKRRDVDPRDQLTCGVQNGPLVGRVARSGDRATHSRAVVQLT